MKCNSINIVEIQTPDLVQRPKVTEGLTGSEIEDAFVEALYAALDSGGEAPEKQPTDLTTAGVLTEFVPLSKLMAVALCECGNKARIIHAPLLHSGCQAELVVGQRPYRYFCATPLNLVSCCPIQEKSSALAGVSSETSSLL